MNTAATTAPQNTLGARKASPTMMGLVGMNSGRRRWSAVQIISTRPTSTERQAHGDHEDGNRWLAQQRADHGALDHRRPAGREASTAAGMASHSGRAHMAAKVKNR